MVRIFKEVISQNKLVDRETYFSFTGKGKKGDEHY